MRHRTLFAVLLLTSSCGTSWLGVRGSGRIETVRREVESFTQLEIRTPVRFEGTGRALLTRAGEAPPARHLEVEGDDNLLPLIETEVVGGRLVISSRERYSTEAGITIRCDVDPGLETVAVNGSGSIDLTGLRSGELDVDIAGSGDIEIGGSADELEAAISGSGSLRLGELVAARAVVRIAGSGSIRVHAKESIDARISGSGSIRYAGDPERVKTEIHGSGGISAVD